MDLPLKTIRNVRLFSRSSRSKGYTPLRRLNDLRNTRKRLKPMRAKMMGCKDGSPNMFVGHATPCGEGAGAST
jgi:hypothetical protein